MQDTFMLCLGWNGTQHYGNLLGPCQEREIFFLFSIASELVQKDLGLKGLEHSL